MLSQWLWVSSGKQIDAAPERQRPFGQRGVIRNTDQPRRVLARVGHCNLDATVIHRYQQPTATTVRLLSRFESGIRRRCASLGSRLRMLRLNLDPQHPQNDTNLRET
jgi:hypothetical protein